MLPEQVVTSITDYSLICGMSDGAFRQSVRFLVYTHHWLILHHFVTIQNVADSRRTDRAIGIGHLFYSIDWQPNNARKITIS